MTSTKRRVSETLAISLQHIDFKSTSYWRLPKIDDRHIFLGFLGLPPGYEQRWYHEVCCAACPKITVGLPRLVTYHHISGSLRVGFHHYFEFVEGD